MKRGAMIRGRANVIIDGQWGSTGKGKLAAWLCQHERPELAVCDYMPNAGHTYVDDDGVSLTFCQLPVAAAFGIDCYIGPHASINVELFKKELKSVRDRGIDPEVWVHPLATVVAEEDKTREQSEAGRIANTAKGGHSASVKKILRSRDAVLAKDDPFLRHHVKSDFHQVIQKRVAGGDTCLIETAQGFDLGLNHGWSYPFVTGRDCLIGRVMDNAGLPLRRLGSIIGSLRAHPIRVGNTSDGQSGPFYPDQQELTWEQLSKMMGKDIKAELTTVTKRVRRVFTFSDIQLRRFLSFVAPTHAFLNFVNYLPKGADDSFVKDLNASLMAEGCDLFLLGTGPKQSDVVRL